MFSGQFFVKNAKKTLEHFLNGPNRTNFQNRKNAEIAGNSVKNGLFDLFHQNPSIFQDIYMKFCTHICLTGFFHIYSGFLKIQKKNPNFLKNIFLIIFQNFQKSRQQFDRKVHSQSSVENQLFLSFKLFV